MTFGSLFAGVGGLDLGFEWAGLTCRWQVEQNPFCLAVLERHWPHVTRYTDVRDVGVANLEPVDVLVGGFPCQDVSDAGLRAGIDGARSGLWAEYARIVCELRPRYVVVENVRGLLVRGIDRVLGDLAELGYDAEWTSLRAADVGAPHRRERIFIVAYAQRDAEGRYAANAGDGRAVSARSGGRLEHADLSGQRIAGEGDTGRECGSRWDAATGASGAVADAGSTRVASGLPAAPRLGEGHTGEPDHDGSLCRWPARPGEAQYGWEPPRVLRRAESGVGVVPDGLPPGLVRHRRRALEALGNAVVPQCAYLVALRVLELADRAEHVA